MSWESHAIPTELVRELICLQIRLLSNKVFAVFFDIMTQNPRDYHRIEDQFRINVPFQNECSYFHQHLEKRNLDKDNLIRIFSWLYEFNILSSLPRQWPREIESKHLEYEKIKRNFGELEEFDDERVVLKNDLERSLQWFNNLREYYSLPVIYYQKGFNVGMTVFYILKHNDNEEYIQGYDRFFFVAYLMGALYDVAFKTNCIESISYFLTKNFVNICLARQYTSYTASEFESAFSKIDDIIKVHYTKIHRHLDNPSSSSFATSWFFVFFADVYEGEIEKLLLIWDHIILNKNELEEYLSALTIAHVKQIARTFDPRLEYSLTEFILDKKDYNVIDIINDSYNNDSLSVGYVFKFVSGVVVLAIIVIIVVLLLL